MAVIRDAVLACLGGEPGQRHVVGATVVTDGPVQDLILHLDTGYAVPATYIAPRGAGAAPALVYCHAHGARYDIGRSELVTGRPALSAPYAGVLAAAGYGVLCLEMPCFGARADLDENATAKARLWHGRTLFGQMLAEQMAGLGWLARQPGIDPARIGTMGISMGGTLAWWLAALDDRVAAMVSIACFADMGRLIETGAHDIHGNYMTVPGVLAHGRTGQVAGLAAPRPALYCIGLQDPGTPQSAVEIAKADVESAYAQQSAGQNLRFHIAPDVGHAESPEMRKEILSFLKETLFS